MNDTMLSQIVWFMFLPHHCLPKVAKNCKKGPKVDFCVNYFISSDDSDSDDTGTVSLAASRRPASNTGCQLKNGHPCHTKFDLFSIILGKSDERMPYRLGLGNSFAVVSIAVTCLVQELY